jgi:hypothetical protein
VAAAGVADGGSGGKAANGGGSGAVAIDWSSALAQKPEINNNAREKVTNGLALLLIEPG